MKLVSPLLRTGPAVASALLVLGTVGCTAPEQPAAARPNFVLVMADDMGWGQTGYYNHPVLETPQLDAMAASGLRFDRFYAGAPNCSPTRATVMTGRTHDRTGVEDHGYALRRQERTIARALDEAGYATGHFGKWHLNGLRGPGVPILAEDAHNPGVFGFDTWLSVTNFFERDPLMSREGLFVQHQGDSSEVIVAEALRFMRRQVEQSNPFFTVIWYGTPHSPWIASEEDREAFASLDKNSQHHYGELVAMDRSIGALRAGLRELRVEHNTVLWFTSDNGGLPRIEPGTVGGLRGFKGSLYEGGIRVPAIIEWPDGIQQARVTEFPAVTMDIFPTVSAIAGLPQAAALQPQDGIDLQFLFAGEDGTRETPIGFRHLGKIALIDNDLKIVRNDADGGTYEVFDLAADPNETADISAERPDEAARLRETVETWNASVEASANGADYPDGDFDIKESERRAWMTQDGYAPYIDEWRGRPEYVQYIDRALGP
ncbi:MAG: sulfatase-like hydrolase/transferase [Bryobacterales bacterium]|nr:sulfatase-like hydrolase/transferase [Bryobacterales bacterium]MDE0265368.1 sulfatase-like hydrolase/transferase [Bryobacterales bacterium]MDE0621756.1 sulfatase-like hydrolase/transferase [Bryobacterales bacterium]